MQRIQVSLLIMVLLLTLVGQAVASVTMSCEMPHMSQQQLSHTPNETMHHDMSSNMMNMDCCDDELGTKQDCSCPITACSSHSILSLNELEIVTSFISDKIQLDTIQNQSRRSSSLYRPPMSA